jgi:hypothetical protein
MTDRIPLARLAKSIALATYSGWMACCCGNQTNLQARLFNQGKKIQPGDMVVEISTIWVGLPGPRNNNNPNHYLDSVGVLTKITREPMFTPEEWDENTEGEPIPTESVYYLNTLDGREFRWTNCEFIRVPNELD